MEKDIDRVLAEAVRMGASDIHITVKLRSVFRCNGELIQHGDFIWEIEDIEKAVQKILPESIKGFYRKRDLDFSYSIEGVSRFRVNVFYQRGSTGISFRVIPNEIPDFDKLGLPLNVKDLVKKESGLFLVTGPTGSGKSTSLASLIDYINKTEKKRIITLEDPIEYLHKHNQSIIEQRELGSDIPSFHEGLKSALRQDPDIILVGELRDRDTMQTALKAAETGHLVLGTLHTRDAASTISRIIDSFEASQQRQLRNQLSESLIGVMSQRLIKPREGKGRVPIVELMINNEAIGNLIRSEKVQMIKGVISTSRALGMMTFEHSIENLVKNRVIDSEQAKRLLYTVVS